MKKTKKIASIFLQVMGLLFILCLGVIFYSFVASPWTEETIDSARQVNAYLVRGGLLEEQPITIVSGSASYHPFMDDYEKDWCVQLEVFTISNPFQNHWQSGDSGHPVIDKIKRSDLIDVAAKCFGNDVFKKDNLLFFILEISSSATKDEYQFNQIDGFEAMVYDPETLRIAFYGHQI